MVSETEHWGRLAGELRQIYGDDHASMYLGRHHARYFREDTTYHIISRTLLGHCLMRPDKWFNTMAAGVIGRAQEHFESIELYAYAFLSSHFHLELRGEPADIVRFVGFIKGEISRRLGQRIGRPGHMWDGRYLATALPTSESEVRCLEYILAHGVKEHLVGRSTDWPGLHAAKQLTSPTPLRGEWFDGTSYGRAKYDAQRRVRPGRINPSAFTVYYTVQLTRLPAWRDLSEDEVRAEVAAILTRIEEQGRESRKGKRPLGARAILNTPRTHARVLPPPPWFEDRRKMICWSDHRDPHTRHYLDSYWAFQRAFRAASEGFRRGALAIEFPSGSYSPPMYRPPPA